MAKLENRCDWELRYKRLTSMTANIFLYVCWTIPVIVMSCEWGLRQGFRNNSPMKPTGLAQLMMLTNGRRELCHTVQDH
eukprot:5182082-Pyramimonas_sp.AAC.2